VTSGAEAEKSRLLQATHRAAEAASAGELEALQAALDARAEAMPGATAEERAAAFAHGAAAVFLLRALRRRMGIEKTLLEKHILEPASAALSGAPSSGFDLSA